jgi:hypothetical protein
VSLGCLNEHREKVQVARATLQLGAQFLVVAR